MLVFTNLSVCLQPRVFKASLAGTASPGIRRLPIIIGVWMQIFTGRVDTIVRISIIVGHVLFNAVTVSGNGLHNHHEGDHRVILR